MRTTSARATILLALAFALAVCVEVGGAAFAQVPPLQRAGVPPFPAVFAGAHGINPLLLPTVAVLPVSVLHLPRLDARAETERIRESFTRTGRFRVLSEAETAARLRAAGVKDERCLEIECAVEFGAALKVQKLLTAQILQLGRRALIRVRYVDVGAAKAELAEQAEFVGDPSAIASVLREVVARAYAPAPAAATQTPPVALSYDGPETPFYAKPWFYITVGAVVAAGTAAGLVLGLRSSGNNSGSASFGFLRAK